MEKIAFEVVVQKLEGQRADLANTRNQASISAAIVGLIGTLFATLLGSEGTKQVMGGDSVLGLSVVGGILSLLFFSSIACSTLVLIGLDEFTFSFDAKGILDVNADLQDEIMCFKKLALDGEWFFDDNENKIGKAQTLLWWSLVLGVCQIIPWLILIESTAYD